MGILTYLRKLESEASPAVWETMNDHASGNNQGYFFMHMTEGMTAGADIWRAEDATFIATARNVFPILLSIAEAAEWLVEVREFFWSEECRKGTLGCQCETMDTLRHARKQLETSLKKLK